MLCPTKKKYNVSIYNRYIIANYQPTTPTKSNVPRCINRIDFEVTEIHQEPQQNPITQHLTIV